MSQRDAGYQQIGSTDLPQPLDRSQLIELRDACLIELNYHHLGQQLFGAGAQLLRSYEIRTRTSFEDVVESSTQQFDLGNKRRAYFGIGKIVQMLDYTCVPSVQIGDCVCIEQMR